MYRKLPRFALALLLLHPAGAAAAPLPAPFEAEYEGRRFPLAARATLALARAGDFYKYTLRGAVYLGFYEVTSIYDCSVMELRDGMLRPLEYLHRDGRKSRRNLHTRFDWASRSARTALGDGSVLEVNGLEDGAWDVMSIQVRLRMDVPGAKPGDTFVYRVVHKDDVTRHRTEVEGRETVVADGRRIETVKVRAEGPKRTNRFWFADDYAWLPVRLTISDVSLRLASPPEKAARPAGPQPEEAPKC